MQRYRLLLCALIALLSLVWLSASPAGAQKDEHPPRAKGSEDHAAKAKGHGAEKEADPPIFTPVRIDLGIWTLVVFFLLLFVLSKWAWDPMLEGLKKREETIRSALDEAQRARDEAERLSTELQKKMNQAYQEAQQILEQARVNAQKQTEAMIAEARADIKAERERLHKDIELARDQALEQIWGQTAQLASLVSTRAIRRQLTPDDHRELVSEALADLKRLSADGKQGVA